MDGFKNNKDAKKTARSILETIVIVFVLGYGLRYIGYFLRARYYNWLDTLSLDPGISHCFDVPRASGFAHHFFVICLSSKT